MLFACVFGAIGFLDDWEKLAKKQNLGLTAKAKFLLQLVASLVFVLLIVYIVMYFVWRRSALGRSMYAVGGNANCARVSGINVDRTRIAAFTISGLMAGLGGVMLSSKMGSINSVFGSTYSMDIIAAAVIVSPRCPREHEQMVNDALLSGDCRRSR